MNWLRSNCYQRNFCSVPRILEGFYSEALLIELNGTNRWTDCYLYKKTIQLSKIYPISWRYGSLASGFRKQRYLTLFNVWLPFPAFEHVSLTYHLVRRYPSDH